jgi:hypothetical protein
MIFGKFESFIQDTDTNDRRTYSRRPAETGTFNSQRGRK